MRFLDNEHKKFFAQRKSCCGSEKKKLAFLYLLGLLPETREHWSECYDLEDGKFKDIKKECFYSAWKTKKTTPVLVLAFELFGIAPTKTYPIFRIFENQTLYPFLIQALDIRFGASRKEGTGRPREYDESDAKAVSDLHATGMSIRTIAAVKGMSTATVQRLLKMQTV